MVAFLGTIIEKLSDFRESNVQRCNASFCLFFRSRRKISSTTSCVKKTSYHTWTIVIVVIITVIIFISRLVSGVSSYGHETGVAKIQEQVLILTDEDGVQSHSKTYLWK